jgi:hypothetical protein
LPVVQASQANLQHGLEIVFGIIGAVAVIMIIIGALQFALAQGDPNAVIKARNIIIYAVVGLAVAISAEAIVIFVVGNL